MATPLDRLLDALPGTTVDELRSLAGEELTKPGPPSYAGVQAAVVVLLTSEEQAVVRDRLGTGGTGAAPILRALFRFPELEAVRRLAARAGVLGRTDWLRFVLGRLPGARPPRRPLPLHPELVYRQDGLVDDAGLYRSEPERQGEAREERFWSFPLARDFIRSRGILNQVEWYAYARGDLARFIGRRPAGIPFNPAREYQNRGYEGMRDWIGGPWHDPALPGYLNFRKARALVRQLEIRDVRQWRAWVRGRIARDIPRPRNLPVLPELAYPDCWRGFGDLLGVSSGASPEQRGWRPFEEARAFSRSLGLSTVAEWRRYVKGEVAGQREFPDDIPANPENVYESSGFRGYGDWLGSDRSSVHDRAYRPFEAAREFARAHEIRSETEWGEWSARGLRDLPPRPPDIPALPYRAYAEEGWTGWGDFLGTGNPAPFDHHFRPFDGARSWARGLRLSSNEQWRAVCRGEIEGVEKPDDIPASPERVYGEDWNGWGDFLGTGTVSTRDRRYRPFAEARRFARSLRLRRYLEWRALCRGELPGKFLPEDIPAAPDNFYSGQGWTDWGDFLGTGNVHPGRREFRTFPEARVLARSLGLGNKDEWAAWVSGRLEHDVEPPDDVPADARNKYLDQGWSGWGDFLGTGNLHARDRSFRSFQDARRYARALPVSSALQWRAFCRGEVAGHPRPPDIPVNPDVHYRDRGWQGWRDFLRG